MGVFLITRNRPVDKPVENAPRFLLKFQAVLNRAQDLFLL